MGQLLTFGIATGIHSVRKGGHCGEKWGKGEMGMGQGTEMGKGKCWGVRWKGEGRLGS